MSKAAIADPYAMYRALRERDPVHRSWLVEGWVFSRAADVIGILRDNRFSADERNTPGFETARRRLIRAGVFEEDDPYEPTMLRSDPPDHTRLRSLVSQAFTPRAIESLRPRIESVVDELLSAVGTTGRVDVIEALAYPLPVIVISEMLGIPREDRARFKRWSDEIVRGLGISSFEDMRASRDAGLELRNYLVPIVEARRSEPRDDLISGLVQAEAQGDRLTEQEVYATINLLLVAGNETTANLIGNGLIALLRHPDQIDLLRGDPALVENGVEELLRYDSPVQATSRIATEDIEVGGRVVARGQQALVLLGSANRDPERFPDPDRLDVTRPQVRHLSFSQGIHFCLGAQLARLEAQVALGALIARFPGIKLDVDEPEWRPNAILRGPKEVPIRF